jgi:hypothetical protein
MRTVLTLGPLRARARRRYLAAPAAPVQEAVATWITCADRTTIVPGNRHTGTDYRVRPSLPADYREQPAAANARQVTNDQLSGTISLTLLSAGQSTRKGPQGQYDPPSRRRVAKKRNHS